MGLPTSKKNDFLFFFEVTIDVTINNSSREGPSNIYLSVLHVNTHACHINITLDFGLP